HAPLAAASDRVNELTKENLLGRVINSAPKGSTVLVLGMSYKPDTYITEESAGLHLAHHLKQQEYRVLIHDFAANAEKNRRRRHFELVSDLNPLAKRSDVDLALVCCPWPQYRSLKFAPSTKFLATWQL